MKVSPHPAAGSRRPAPSPCSTRMSANVRVVTVNTWKNEGDFPARLAALSSGLAGLNVDVLLLQEVFQPLESPPSALPATGPHLAVALGLGLTYAPARRARRKHGEREVDSFSGLALLSRYPIIHHEVILLPGDQRGGERIALLAEVSVDGRPLLIGNVHLSHLRGDDEGRRRQLAVVLRHPFWRRPGAVRLLGGDFNAPPDSAVFAETADALPLQLHDVLAGRSDRLSTHPLPPRPGGVGRRIDFLFQLTPPGLVPAAVVDAGLVLHHPIHGIWPSDHAGVCVDLALTAPGGAPKASRLDQT